MGDICRKYAPERGQSYPRSACNKCGWRIGRGNIDSMCLEQMQEQCRVKVNSEVLSLIAALLHKSGPVRLTKEEYFDTAYTTIVMRNTDNGDMVISCE